VGALGGGLARVPSGVWELAGIQSMTCPFRVRVVATMLGFGGRSAPPGPHGSELAFARLISAESFVTLHPSPATRTPMSDSSRGSEPGARERQLRRARSIEALTQGIGISLQLSARAKLHDVPEQLTDRCIAAQSGGLRRSYRARAVARAD
jgi:hypothetical protein